MVNDGGEPSCREIFDKLATMDGCQVVHHAINLGKGGP
ncbi:MAG: glycosyltransferase [Comamonadaceae bacterium]|nr:glycosyltransferase [Comamonadaceae bacterium]